MAVASKLYSETVGPVTYPARANSEWRVKWLKNGVAKHLPSAWTDAIDLEAKRAASAGAVWEHDRLKGDAYAHWLTEYAGADNADMSESDIRTRAEVLAARAAAARFTALPDGSGAWPAWNRLCEFVQKYGGVIPKVAGRYRLESVRKRAECPAWWRRQLRRYVAQCYERGAIELGRVGADAKQWYCSDRAVVRRIQQVQANEAAMRAANLESASGQRMSVYDAAQLSTSNKAIRRGELMTRIRGCEQWADSSGLVGLFTTNTCPSRFHSQRKGGGKNPKYDGSTPADAQAWLCRTWAACRSKLARDGLSIVGFRVAEPHHDGCPHWHMLIWCRPEESERVQGVIRKWWLKDKGGERGAAENRVNIKAMISGQASGYVAKYISKNIDDVYTTSHVDQDEAPGLTVGPDLFGEVEVLPCQRVEAWASLWRIRQFQAIGQPPVTVWREFRRVGHQEACGGSDAFVLAWGSCHRHREKLADWAGYIRHQGGVMLARGDYRFCVNRLEKARAGRYEKVVEKWGCGVVDRGRIASRSSPPSVRGGVGRALPRSAQRCLGRVSITVRAW